MFTLALKPNLCYDTVAIYATHDMRTPLSWTARRDNQNPSSFHRTSDVWAFFPRCFHLLKYTKGGRGKHRHSMWPGRNKLLSSADGRSRHG